MKKNLISLIILCSTTLACATEYSCNVKLSQKSKETGIELTEKSGFYSADIEHVSVVVKPQSGSENLFEMIIWIPGEGKVASYLGPAPVLGGAGVKIEANLWRGDHATVTCIKN